MTFDIQEHARSAQAAYQAALARLNTARTAYETGGGAAYAAAKAQRDLLERKIKEADDEVLYGQRCLSPSMGRRQL